MNLPWASVRVGRRSPRLIAILRLLALGDLRQLLPSGANPSATLLGRALTGRLLPGFTGCRIGIQFLFQLSQLLFGVGQRFFERRLAAERSGARTGADFHPVLRHAIQGDQALSHQAGHAVREEEGPTTLHNYEDDLTYLVVRARTNNPDTTREIALVGAWDVEGENLARLIAACQRLLAACQAVVERWEHGDVQKALEAATQAQELLMKSLPPAVPPLPAFVIVEEPSEGAV
jgi:hypothetical protein